MYIFNKVNSLALMGGLGLVFSGLVACNDDSASHSRANDDPPVKIDTVKKVDSITGDTITQIVETPGQKETVRTIDPVSGDTVYEDRIIYVPADTTVRWVGNSSLVITEISPVNLDWLDENGDDPGWIEIYNAGDVAANLMGYALVENLEKPRKWVFGDELIAPHSFRTVFCDKNDVNAVAPSADTTVYKSRTHTNWKLNKDGGTVYLIDQYYSIRDSVQYPALSAGMSWGIIDGGAWKFFEKPTPEQPNNVSDGYEGVSPSISFGEHGGGFYNGSVTLNKPNVPEGVSVRCTKDGSVPTKNSEKFESDMKIETTTVLRCAAFKDGLLTKDITTNTYFIDETANMPVVAVSVDPSFFEKYYKKTNGGEPDMKHDQMYAPNESYPNDSGELPVHVEYYEKGRSSKGKAWEADGGISLMGGWSRMERKKSVAILP